jgi:MtN3 and saliva related transmembrane protein
MAFDVEWIGFAAAVLTTVAFVPQVVRTWQLGGRELSWSMLGLFGTGVLLWLVYGILQQSRPLIVANGLTLLQVAAMAAVKFSAVQRQ